MPTPPDLSTELKAVNILLGGMGETPIESLDAVQSSLASKAINALDETSLTLQTKGWYWNTEEEYPLSPDPSGYLNLPINTIAVSRAYTVGGDQLIQRGQRLYNRKKRTFVFPQGETVKVDITLKLDWDDLPEFAKQPIFYIAQKRLQMRELTSTAINKAIETDVDGALAILEQNEDKQGPANRITDNLDSEQNSSSIRRRRR